MEKLALAYPSVGFRLVSDDRTVFHLKPQDEVTRIRAILADGEDFPLLTVTNEQDGFRDLGLQIRLHWLQGMSSPQSRKLIQIVNSRVIRDRMLQQAILGPFRQALLPGQYPSVVLSMKVNPAAIDVNVHPTKTEIRFLDSRKIFQSIDSLLRSLILQKGAPAIAPMSLHPMETQNTPLTPGTWDSRNSFGASHASSSPTASTSPIPQFSNPPQASAPWQFAERPFPERANSPSYSGYSSYSSSPPSVGTFQAPAAGTDAPEISPPHPLQFAKQIGILFQTYLVYEQQSEMILIDQHAAHERIQYEKLRKRVLNSQIGSSQALLIPEVVKFSQESQTLLQSRLSWITKLGFECEIFGEDSLVFRSVPAEWGTRQLKVRLKNLIERTLEFESGDESENQNLLMDENLFEKLASEACHSAIRAGDSLELIEAKALIEQLFQCEHPWNCPHGRPTVVKVPQGKLEEWFQRKI
jgi:DNA mismatch repair protein MutL